MCAALISASLSGQVIWITGASSGIGEALAYILAAAGSKLVLSARRQSELQRVKQRCVGTEVGQLQLPHSYSHSFLYCLFFLLFCKLWPYPIPSLKIHFHRTVVAFSLRAKILGECLTIVIHSPPALFFFFFQMEISSSTPVTLFLPGSVQQAEATVAECSLTSGM